MQTFSKQDIAQLWNRIKTLCKDRKITHIKLCQDCNIDLGKFKGQLANNVEPKVSDIIKIAEYFGTTAEYLVTGTSSELAAKENEVLKEKIQKAIEVLQYGRL